ncbi:MAG: hypothetical protein ACFFF4_05155 [Candidatus Thorarchaeota archaeon]
MVNTEKTLKRERTRLRKSQNPQQMDLKKMRKVQKVRTKFWKSKIHGKIAKPVVVEDKKKPKKDKPKKDKEPELEILEEEPELEVIDEELEELYDYDEEEVEEDLEDEIEEDLEDEDSE